MFNARTEDPSQAQEDKEDDGEIELSWKITIMTLSGSHPSDYERDRVFYSDSTRDIVELIIRPPAKENMDRSVRSKQYEHYLHSPSAFFGLDHPVIRRMIRSLSGEKAVASRMWLRYRENQKLLQWQCSEYGCFHQMTTTTTPNRGPTDCNLTTEQFQQLRVEQSSNVALYWNGRRMNTAATSSAAFGDDLRSINRKDSVISGLGHDEDSKEVTDPKNKISEKDFSLHIAIPRDLDNTIPGANRSSTDMEALQVNSDMRVYAMRAFEPDEMILEYVGELISPAVALRRQETYQSQGRGCFMMWCEFHEAVIDATHQGGVARHIRHEGYDNVGKGCDGSHDGTVYARTVVLSTNRSPKVVICASRRLKAGDELTIRYSS
ncbi:histone methyltransferase set1 [Modicella reniformis]|uniref:Histone methyltransferase set1 n=1 Tax=Modicella reniformis TaxID=1440133 RepID=A0A9P6SMB8_9FUNG|nr:histone methyltransferase set1 [Modicella reniformis]